MWYVCMCVNLDWAAKGVGNHKHALYFQCCLYFQTCLIRECCSYIIPIPQCEHQDDDYYISLCTHISLSSQIHLIELLCFAANTY